jgi:serine/threonine protein phosphatase PrpC
VCESRSRVVDVRPEDVVALVSNGLYDALSGQQVAWILGGRGPLHAMADHLVRVAEAHRAPGDVSCVLPRCIAEKAAPAAHVAGAAKLLFTDTR